MANKPISETIYRAERFNTRGVTVENATITFSRSLNGDGSLSSTTFLAIQGNKRMQQWAFNTEDLYKVMKEIFTEEERENNESIGVHH